MRYLRKPIGFLLILLPLVFFSHPVHSASPQDHFHYYQKGKSDYQGLVRVNPTQSNRSRFIKCIQLFEYIANRYPQDPNADEALFSAGNLYLALYRGIGYRSDRDGALTSYQRVVDRYPNSRLADDAQYKIGELHEQDRNFYLAGQAYQGVIQKFPKGDMTKMARARLQSVNPAPPKPAPPAVKKNSLPKPGPKEVSLNNVRHWSSPNYTRVVLDLNGMTAYTADKDDATHRLVIRLAGTRLSPSVLQKTEIKDGVVTVISISPDGTGGVKVAAEFNQVSRYRVFPLKEPFRVVMDFYRKTEEKAPPPPPAVPQTQAKGQALPAPTATPLYGIKTIVIDPGHGGKDPGAIGPGGTKEKTVTLAIAKKLRDELKKDMNCKVILTRETDRYVDLEERTAIANMAQADLFISIHANASKNRNSHGTETYFLSPARSVDELETAARENMIAKASMDEIENDLTYILSDMQNTANVNDSSQLAGEIQRALVRGTRDQNSKVRDLGVKQAMFYVLLESRMPSVLVETAFISNRAEEKRLSSSGYQWSVAQAISSGIGSYAQENRLAYREE